MTRIKTSKYKISRRLGQSVWGDGKDPVNVRNYKPGQHGPTNKMVKSSDYGQHLAAKQLVKAHYGRITERQFSNLFSLASKLKGNTAENFANLLESRLDMIVYRLKFAPSIFAARQMVSHGHIRLNGKKVNIPSMTLKVGDKIQLRDRSRDVTFFLESMQSGARSVPDYLSLDADSRSGSFVRNPMIADIPYPFKADFRKIVEYYSA